MTDLRVTLTDRGFDFEEVETAHPEPGERCPACDRRVPKPRTSTSPASRRLVVTGPADRIGYLIDALDALQAFVGADPHSYPRLSVLEALALLGGQHRELLRHYFEKEDDDG